MNLLLADTVGQIFNEKDLATYRNIYILASSLSFPLGRLDLKVPAAHRLAMLLQSIIILFLVVEHDVSIAEASSCILVFGKFYFGDALGVEEVFEVFL